MFLTITVLPTSLSGIDFNRSWPPSKLKIHLHFKDLSHLMDYKTMESVVEGTGLFLSLEVEGGSVWGGHWWGRSATVCWGGTELNRVWFLKPFGLSYLQINICLEEIRSTKTCFGKPARWCIFLNRVFPNEHSTVAGSWCFQLVVLDSMFYRGCTRESSLLFLRGAMHLKYSLLLVEHVLFQTLCSWALFERLSVLFPL